MYYIYNVNCGLFFKINIFLNKQIYIYFLNLVNLSIREIIHGEWRIKRGLIWVYDMDNTYVCSCFFVNPLTCMLKSLFF